MSGSNHSIVIFERDGKFWSWDAMYGENYGVRPCDSLDVILERYGHQTDNSYILETTHLMHPGTTIMEMLNEGTTSTCLHQHYIE